MIYRAYIWGLTVLLLFNISNLFSQSEDEFSSLFQETASDICKFSHFKGEFTGSISNEISSNVYKIIYETADSSISVKQKLDLLHLMIYYQRFAFKEYRANVRHDFLNNECDLNNNNLLFIFPLAICDNCDFEIINKINSLQDTCIENMAIPSEYINYYSELLKYFSRSHESDIKRTSGLYSRKLIELEIISKDWFKKNYPCILSIGIQ